MAWTESRHAMVSKETVINIILQKLMYIVKGLYTITPNPLGTI